MGVRRPEFRALNVVFGRHRSRAVAPTRSAGHARLRTPTSLVRGLPRGTKEGLPEAQRASQGSQRRNPSVIGDPRRPSLRRPAPSRQRPATNLRLHTRHWNRALHSAVRLRSAKRSGLKRVVCYPCYAFKVCRLAEWGRGAGENSHVPSLPTTKLQAASDMLALSQLSIILSLQLSIIRNDFNNPA